MPLNIPIILLRNFTAIVNCGSMARAAERVYLSQSALSLQMKKLSELIGQPIFERQGGKLSLTPLGDRLFSYSKEIITLHDRIVSELGSDTIPPVRLGLTPILADMLLDSILRELSARVPNARLRITIEHSADLREALDTDELDVAVYFSENPDLTSIAQSPYHWFGNPDLLDLPELPVAVMSRPSFFRDLVVDALEAMGHPYEIALSSSSVPALIAAVRSGTAITCLPAEFLKNEMEPLPLADTGLASLSYCLRVRSGVSEMTHQVADVVARLINEMLAAPDVPEEPASVAMSDI